MPVRFLPRERRFTRWVPAGARGQAVIDLRDDVATLSQRSGTESVEGPKQLRESKFFGSAAFRRLWFSQVASSLGDWIGLGALTLIATRISDSPSAVFGGISLVLAARLIPGLFMSPFAGVAVDRWDRKKIMVACDFGRASVLCTLPFVDNIWQLFLASLLLEMFTLLWSPAKEASVPHLVKPSFLPTANSLSLAAAYGTIPFAAGTLALLVKIPEWSRDVPIIQALDLTDESLALYFDAFTYMVSAAVIATLVLPRGKPGGGTNVTGKRAPLIEARDGWRYVATNTRVRSVIVGMSTGLIGGAMIVPLGSVFADEALGAGQAGYGLLLAGMGAGVAIGVVGLTIFQKRLPVEQAFVMGLLGAGISLSAAATMSGLTAAVICAAFLGLFAGSTYVLGLTCIQVNAEDHMRGRVFATMYTLTRVCILLALTVAPLLSIWLGRLSMNWFGGSVQVLGGDIGLPGVRISLWLGGLILILAGLLAAYSLRRPEGQRA